MIKCNIVYLDMGDEFHLHGVRTLTKKKTIFYLKKNEFSKINFLKTYRQSSKVCIPFEVECKIHIKY